MKFTTINIQGNIFNSEILEKIRLNDISFQKPEDFGLKPNESVRDEISNAWSLANTHWQIFKQKRTALSVADTGTSETRRYWMLPLLNLLGYDISTANAQILNNKSYAISHKATNKDDFPIHIVSSEDSLDKRAKHGARISPHALMQEYLNATEYVYGFISNGLQFRILRDATQLSKLSYLEFNLEQMLEEGHFAEFALFYRLVQASRIANQKEEGKDSILEFYHREAIESGSRIRERLSDAVYVAIIDLATGFLRDPENEVLREKVKIRQLDAAKYYSKILKIVYRILFLNILEERDLIYPENLSATETAHKDIYEKFYSLSRLIKLADKKVFVDQKKKDLWQAVEITFRLFEDEYWGQKLSIKPLGFGLFSPAALNDVHDLQLSNEIVLKVIEEFCYFKNENGQRVRVNYADLNVEELGSVYEGLLALSPMIFNSDNEQISFGFKEGMGRKNTASYYTHHSLVKELVKTNLIPLIEERLSGAEGNKEQQKKILLDFKICDPSVGSGHMLLEAARTLAYYYVKVDTDAEPNPAAYRKAIRLVIQHCLYGVDLNEEAVELCKLALWLEGHNSGAPLSFLDHKIKLGNSLVGVRNPEFMKDGIPSNAFDAKNKEEKKWAQELKKRNSFFQKSSQYSFDFSESGKEVLEEWNKNHQSLIEIDQSSVEGVEKVKRKYHSLITDKSWTREWTRCNLWCTPFFANYTEALIDQIPTTEDLKNYQQNPTSINPRKISYANLLAHQNKFFHWFIEFPEVYAKGGFDLMMGNPPWDKIKVQEKEFFTNKNDEIVNAPNAAKRKRMIAQLEETDPELYEQYLKAVHQTDSTSNMARNSGQFELTGQGDINLYAVFAELFYTNINSKGRAGLVCPTGIATDNNTKDFFGKVVTDDRLISFYDFENKLQLFPIHRSFKFCLMSMGHKIGNVKSQFAFFLHEVSDLQHPDNVFELSIKEFTNINPNTKTTPVFRTKKDAEITTGIYARLPIIHNKSLNQNLWELSFVRQFDMTNDSGIFYREKELDRKYKPLYESKFIWFYDHRAGSFEGIDKRTVTHQLSEEEHQEADKKIEPWYWVKEEDILPRTDVKYYIGFRNIARTTDSRTAIFSLIPFSGVSNSMPLIFIKNTIPKFLFLSQVSTLVFDYFVRQKLGGTNMNYNYVRQFPSLSPKTFTAQDRAFILPKVAELAYTAWDIKNAFDDLWQEADKDLKQLIIQQWEENKAATGGHEWKIPDWAENHPEIAWEKEEGIPLPPFMWDEERRHRLKSELDAYYALLFGLERKELEYILDPKAVMGKNFPSESFRVLKEKEIKEFGEYKTQRLVLEAYDKLRPTWDMPSHLQILQELWEFHQQDLSKKEEPQKKKAKKKKSKPVKTTTSKVNEEGAYYATSLFEEPNLFNTASSSITSNTKVMLQQEGGQEMKYHITPNAERGKFTGDYKQIDPNSTFAKLLIGKAQGDTVIFAEKAYKIIEVKF